MKNQDGTITVTMDTCVDIKTLPNGIMVIDQNGTNEEEYLLGIIQACWVKYEVIEKSGPGGGWPLIAYTGTKEQLLPLLVCFDAYSRDQDELTKALKDWDGDEDELVDIVC